MSEEFSGCCDRFFGLGPKNYGYRIEENGKTVVKVRGFTSSVDSDKKVNLDAMRDMLVRSKRQRSFVDPLPEKVSSFTIVRGDKESPFTMSPSEKKKVWGIVNDKRVVDWDDPNLKTYPYGY